MGKLMIAIYYIILYFSGITLRYIYTNILKGVSDNVYTPHGTSIIHDIITISTNF